MSVPKRTVRSLPANYNPEKGLKTIAAAEAAEKFYHRAKDSTRLYEAVERKLTEQRHFVIWWDGQKKALGGQPYQEKKSTRRSPATSRSATVSSNSTVLLRKDLPVDKDVLHRWRQRLKDDGKFEKSLLAAQERCRRVCEAEKGSTEQKGASGTGDNEWYTPTEYIELARAVLGVIDLDPASSEKAQETVKAEVFFTPKDDGLKQEWRGRVWLNPPYAQPLIAEFISKLCREVGAERTSAAILLTHNYTDTGWFHAAATICSAICFTRRRVKFLSSESGIASPTQGQAFFYFGSDVEGFAAQFRSVGFIVLPMEAA